MKFPPQFVQIRGNMTFSKTGKLGSVLKDASWIRWLSGKVFQVDISLISAS